MAELTQRIAIGDKLSMSLHKASSAPTELTVEQENLAHDLMQCHGSVRVAREKSGLHFYIACPDCLTNDGEKELYSMHLAINADKYLQGHTGAARCMKTDKVFMIDQLTMWPPLEKRGYRRGPERIADQAIVTANFHEEDEKGRMVPKSPGITVPLNSLSIDHPALAYLYSRQFSAVALERQFNASFCIKEREDIRYRKLLGGFKASPQGRIILEIRQNGVRVGWQARILEMEDETHLYYWQPYREAWVPVKYRETPESPWELKEGWENWDPAKYIMAHGARRNSCLMGYDAARAFNAAARKKKRWCFLTEGPLDAARLGPPAVAVCGKSCSQAQADLLEMAFDTIIVVPDNDAAGSKLETYVNEWLAKTRQIVTAKIPDRRHDAGQLTPQEVKFFRAASMAQARLS